MGWLRHIRTTQELREGYNPEVREYIRAKRRPGALPNFYDDIINKSYYDRSWKRYRSTQYHVKDAVPNSSGCNGPESESGEAAL